MTLDFTKPIQRRDGKPVRILATDAKMSGGKPVVALIPCNGTTGFEYIGHYDLDGKGPVGLGDDFDLVNVTVQDQYPNLWRAANDDSPEWLNLIREASEEEAGFVLILYRETILAGGGSRKDKALNMMASCSDKPVWRELKQELGI